MRLGAPDGGARSGGVASVLGRRDEEERGREGRKKKKRESGGSALNRRGRTAQI